MTRTQYQKLVEGLEELAQQSPLVYKLRVVGLVTLAYAYLALLIGVLVASTLVALWLIQHVHTHNAIVLGIKLGVPLLLLNALVLRALWVPFYPPRGIAISAKEAPHLFAVLEKIRKRLRAPKIHGVLIDDAFNASIDQIPLLGFFGWHRNYLCIGLPLMQTLTSSQLIAVLAHEYGHLAGAHGKFGAWVYRIRMTWARLAERLEDTHYVRPIYAFWRWYAPYFSAYSFVLARADEYYADRAAADIVGTRIAAEALTRIHVVGDFIDNRFWPRLYERAAVSEKPPFMPYAQLPRIVRTALTPAEADKRMQAALQQETGIDDTHPCLSDRLSAIDESAQINMGVGDSAVGLLGKYAAVLIKRMDLLWYRDTAPQWRERYAAKQGERKELAELTKQAGQFELGAAAALRHAQLTETFSGAAPARALYQSFTARFPDHVDGNFNFGRLLLTAGDVRGIDHLNKTMQADERYTPAACELIYRYLQGAGRTQEAALVYRRARKYGEKVDATTAHT